MGPGGTYAAITFGSGLILLLTWLYATVGNPRCAAMLKKSLLFALPILIWPGALFQFPLGMWASVACEEGLKAFASTREESRQNKFWLVALFGVWELTLDKPFWGLVLARSSEGLNRLSVLGYVYATALPVLMHIVTAGIYAFTFERRLWAAFLTSWAVHVAFNESADYFSFSPPVVITQTAVLILMLTTLLARRLSPPISESAAR